MYIQASYLDLDGFKRDFQVVSLSHLGLILGLDQAAAKAAVEARGWAKALGLFRMHIIDPGHMRSVVNGI